MFPIRCYTCNTVLAGVHRDYENFIHANGTTLDAFKHLNIERMCCRRMFLGYVNITEDLINYPAVDQPLDEAGTVLCRKVKITRTLSCA
ncbi:MAG: hypothetical protein CBC12_07180 [Candidatus Puniceispirillum sp. TMED52]|nr:MAG: hypothetical protein CBC12_07180 [Candidatus Puniceispirillum sp. TMED52]RPF81991.1 MAG: hypothetical protein CBC65_001260 [Rhodothermaceae bacterium TMED105]